VRSPQSAPMAPPSRPPGPPTMAAGVQYVLGDFLSQDFPPASCGLIASVAALHQMGERAALRRMNDLLRPGGVLAVAGLARRRRPRDLGVDLAAVPVHLAFKARRGWALVSAPTLWPPPAPTPRSSGWRPGASGGALPAPPAPAVLAQRASRCPDLTGRRCGETVHPARRARQNGDKVPKLCIDTRVDQGVSLTLMQPQARRDGSEVVMDAFGRHRLSSGVPARPLPESTGHAD
jgi:SAM-dependent methyltransferase